MILIYFIIVTISINRITTENPFINRFLVKSSCPTHSNDFTSIRNPSDKRYYFHLVSQSSSISFFSLLSLSYCEHLQSTHYSPSGFAILHSSSRFSFADIDKNFPASSSFHHHNVVLSVTDQSLSSTIVTLMSSNENNLLTDGDSNNITITTINSLLSTTTSTTSSNVSLFHTSLPTTHRGGNRTLNITLLIGCISASIVLIIIIIYALVKYRNRDEGSYKIDESKNFVSNAYIDHNDPSGCGGKTSSSTHHRQKFLSTNDQNGVDSREWYV